MPKHVDDRRRGRYLSLGETYRDPQALLINHALLRRRGYEVHTNTPEEIAAAVRYKIESLSGKAQRVSEDHPLMRRYCNALSQKTFTSSVQPSPRYASWKLIQTFSRAPRIWLESCQTQVERGSVSHDPGDPV